MNILREIWEMITWCWQENGAGKILAVLIVVILLCMVALPGLIYWDAVSWRAYKVEHHCEATGETQIVHTTLLIYPDGKNPMFIPQQTTQRLWACDNGTVWR